MGNKAARWMATVAAAASLGAALGAGPAVAQTIGGRVFTTSTWTENLPAPPGDNNGVGDLVVGLWPAQTTEPGGVPDAAVVLVNNASLPFSYGPYAFTFPGPYSNGDFKVVAWVDGNQDGAYDPGEPHFAAAATVANGASVVGLTLIVTDDANDNGLPDWWELHWFQNMPDPFGQTGSEDTDYDGLSNAKEAAISQMGIGMDFINPADWDSDADGMDDAWEYDYFAKEYGDGMNPTVYNRTDDFDGDGLSDWQEYCGVDGWPRMVSGGTIGGARVGVLSPVGDDSLNPMDVDSDFDLLIDSFEAAWYDVSAKIDPHSGPMTDMPGMTNVDTSVARADPDHDGLSNYREQCLLASFREGAPNGDKWVWEDRVPFDYFDYMTDAGARRRIVLMWGEPLHLGLNPALTIPYLVNRNALRDHEWTDPSEATSYPYVDENIPPGHDTDDDLLPDGWEVQFGLDPRDDGLPGPSTNLWNNGPFGDPDEDGILNLDEYRGQDGERYTTLPYVNGTGDETNPKDYDHRPDSTYRWRWHPEDVLLSDLTDPRVGTGISRVETLGSALPSASLGKDAGLDTDDDGIPDLAEISPAEGVPPSSPVHSCDPFVPGAALIVSPAGILIPDPEPALAPTNYLPAGMREDLQRRDWTIECQVRLLGTNLTGELFDYRTRLGPAARTPWRLSLVKNVPRLTSHIGGVAYTVTANALPTNRWVHLAGVWNHAANSLALYVDGILFNELRAFGECDSGLMLPATNTLTLCASTNGSFVNRLMVDEVRIWGAARTAAQLAAYAHDLVPPSNGDDVWLNKESDQYYGEADSPIVNGGSLFHGEPGTPLDHVYFKAGNFWIDDGDGQYNAARDTLLAADDTLVEGLAGTGVSNARWNDKDGDGRFSRSSLLAYYRFDDGGTSAEDFARRAKIGLLGATREEFSFGDRGYALPTNGFAWVIDGAAPVYGVDPRGADDSDRDGLPDAWEIVNHLDPWDAGAAGESASGALDGPNGAAGDPDGDGLANRYEFWADTNPREADTDGDGVSDAQEDRDGDGVVNLTEQALLSRPDLVDTDDDGRADSEEQADGTSPANPNDPAVSRAIVLGGAPGDYLEVPQNIAQRLEDWTVEAWVRPADATTNGAGIVVRRVVEVSPGGAMAANYLMGLETNGAGGLRVYAGYVLADGTACLVRGGSVPATPADWTHIAATYNHLSRTLTLYTNGMPVVSTNIASSSPPINGKGGETFLRLGEGYAGGMDEVRIWSRVRLPAEILAAKGRTVSGVETSGLVHDVRFDDSQAVTNAFPWSAFHAARGWQDFVYADDWQAQWRHATIARGGIAEIQPGAIIPPPSLRIILEPSSAVADGASWTIDNGTWHASGDNVPGLTPGEHIVTYKPTVGWTEPEAEFVVLTNGTATTLTRAYLKNASVRIGLLPLAAIDEGASWRVDSGDWLATGTVVSNLAPGSHVIEFSSVPNFTTPPSVTTVLAPGEFFERNYVYSVIRGSVTVVLKPTDCIADGARWRLNGGEWLDSGTEVGNLALGNYTVEFGPASRWLAPAAIAVAVSNAQPVVVTGRYAQVTGVSADILPAEAVAAGAQWRVGTSPWTNSGAVVELPAGTYTVSFKPVENWLTPADVTAVVVAEKVTVVGGAYFSVRTVGNGYGFEPGQFYRPRGLGFDDRHRIYVGDTQNDRVQMYDPLTQSWTVWGQYGHYGPAGTFDKPRGVAVDKDGNVYVADQNNDRVQMRSVSNGVWSIVGSLGSGLGQFNGPADVALDSLSRLYVADYYNNRVQRRDTNGVWSVFIANGTAAGRVTAPLNLLVGPADCLYVSDDGLSTNGQQRIQRFRSDGQLETLLGSGVSAEGGLRQPAGMALGGTNLYVADMRSSRVLVSPMTNFIWSVLVGPPALSNAQDTIYDPRGILYVADTEHSRILAVPVVPGAFTNGQASCTATALPGGTNGFVVSWYGTLDWFYAIEYSDSLTPPMFWSGLSGCSNIPGRNMITNCVDATPGLSGRFYRVLAY